MAEIKPTRVYVFKLKFAPDEWIEQEGDTLKEQKGRLELYLGEDKVLSLNYNDCTSWYTKDQ